MPQKALYGAEAEAAQVAPSFLIRKQAAAAAAQERFRARAALRERTEETEHQEHRLRAAQAAPVALTAQAVQAVVLALMGPTLQSAGPEALPDRPLMV